MLTVLTEVTELVMDLSEHIHNSKQMQLPCLFMKN